MKQLLVLSFVFFLINTSHASENGLELSLASDSDYLSFGYNYFDSKRGYEVAVPIVYYSNPASGGLNNNSSPAADRKNQALNIDIILRTHINFKSNTITCNSYWYYGGLVRYTNLKGIPSELNQNGMYQYDKRQSSTKLGLGLNFGFRYFFFLFDTEKFYWGASISYGYYVTGKSNVELENDYGDYSGDIGYENNSFVDYEIAKIGYVF